jgi:multiple sugar transport system permease protein
MKTDCISIYLALQKKWGQENHLRTLPVGLSYFSSGEAESQWHLIMTGATISVIPLIIVFLLLQRHIIKGIVLTGMK